MTTQPSDWAMGEAGNVIGSAKDFSLDLESGYIRNNTEKYHASTITRIALALDAARKVPDRERAELDEILAIANKPLNPPDGCVRLPDGRDAKVLGTLPITADGCVIGDDCKVFYDGGTVCAELFRSANPGESDWRPFHPHKAYSTREAAEAARKDGTR